MKIGGFQKLSLLNYPDKAACTVFTSGCNFHCPFCYNSGLVNGTESIDMETVFQYLQKRKGMLDGVCVTGGEPLMHRDILPFLHRIKQLGYAVKLDTNGSYPEMLQEAISQRTIDYVAMDVKNSFGKYAETSGNPNIDIKHIQKSIDIIKGSGIPHEFRTTVVGEFHTALDIEEIAQNIKGASVWYLQTFRFTLEAFQQGLHAPTEEDMEIYRSIGNRYVKTMVR